MGTPSPSWCCWPPLMGMRKHQASTAPPERCIVPVSTCRLVATRLSGVVAGDIKTARKAVQRD